MGVKWSDFFTAFSEKFVSTLPQEINEAEKNSTLEALRNYTVLRGF